MIEKKINRTAHIYITAFHTDFVRRECRVRGECRHSVEWRQCAERCATEIKVGHLNKNIRITYIPFRYLKLLKIKQKQNDIVCDKFKSVTSCKNMSSSLLYQKVWKTF